MRVRSIAGRQLSVNSAPLAGKEVSAQREWRGIVKVTDCGYPGSKPTPVQPATPSGADMSKPVIFTISAAWDDEASVWSGHCDDIPAAADAPTLDELLAKISTMALDLLPHNHVGVDPASLCLQV